jgi:glc operon protein GlcG
MPLTLAVAEKVIDAARQKAVSLGVNVTIAIVDEGGHLVAMQRMDGANAMSPKVAEGKAVGAAMFRRDGAWLLSTANDRPAFWAAVKDLAGKPIVPGPGSLPLMKDGAMAGAVGVSGAKPDEDHACAEAGVSSIA